MSEQQLRADLQQLKTLVDALPPGDDQRQKLTALVQDMESHLERRDTVSAQTLQEQLEAAVSRFESSHPTAAAIINNVLVTLGNIGV